MLKFYFRKYKVRQERRSPNRKQYILHKENVRILVKNRLEYWNLHYKFSYGRISIRNQRSRWGSCSSKSNLNFSYKIVFLTPSLQDYIIVHELCHRGQFNHSKKFWDLVSETIPNYIERKEELKKIKL